MVGHPQGSRELFHLAARPADSGCRADLAGIEVDVDDQGSWIAQSDDLLKQQRKNLFRTLRLKQAQDRRAALSTPASLHAFRLESRFGRGQGYPQDPDPTSDD